ncbi:MAG: neutral zinc metallopeptidase [Austwickia sp.]|jgi:predicted metalloprotease|nr:MAG: neutral zinc metallopeptidase [Austwickia sp.]
MTFNDDAQLDTSQVGGGGGGGFGRGGAVIGGGGGILGIIALLLYLFTGLGGGGDSTSQPEPAPQQPDQAMDRSYMGAGGEYNQNVFSHCKTGADANKDDNCLVVGTVNSVQDYWKRKFPESTKNQTPYKMTKTILYSGQTQSACGTASNQVGPFYCPLDKQVFIDASFFKLLSSRFGADRGAFAKEYVVAHEYGHAVQDQLGVLDEAQKDPQGPASGGVRVELMADCFAGMWAKDASTTKDKNGNTLLKPLTQQDIQSALSAATAVGDDTIQKKTQGRVSPENFTHGTAEQRMRWFMNGYNNQNINSCNTLRATQL